MYVVGLIFFTFNILYTMNNYCQITDIVIVNILLCSIEIIMIKNKLKFTKKYILFSTLLTLMFMILNKNTIIYGYKNVNIEINSSKTFEINSIYLNDRKLKISNDFDEENEYYIYNKYNSNYSYIGNEYKLNTNKSRKVKIDFEKTSENQEIIVKDSKKNTLNIDKSDIDKNYTFYKSYTNYYEYKYDNVNYNNPLKILNLIFSYLTLFIIINNMLQYLSKKEFYKIYAGLILFIFEFNEIINLTGIDKFLLMILFTIIYKNKSKVKISKKNIIGSFFITFLLIGEKIVNSGNILNNIMLYILFSLWNTLNIEFIVELLKNKKSELKQINIIDKILILLIPTIIFIIYYVLFFPYILSSDGSIQLYEIISNKYTNWHPLLSTLILKVHEMIFGNYNFVIPIRMLITVILIYNILTYFIKHGLNKKIAYLVLILVCFNPVFNINMVTLVKDVDFTIGLIAFTFLLLKYQNEKFRISDYILLFVSILLILIQRHNGIYIIIVSYIILFFIKNKLKLFIGITIPFLIFISLNIILHKKLEVEAGVKNYEIQTAVHGLQAVYEKTEDKEIEKEFEEFYSGEELKKYYNKYNVDVILHFNNNPLRSLDIDKSKVLKLYLKKIMQYPFILIKDRLDGTNLMWDTFKKDYINTYNYQLLYTEYEKNSIISNLTSSNSAKSQEKISPIMTALSLNKVTNTIFFRTGIYIILIIIIMINFYDKKMLISIIPSIMNTITLLLTMHHQSYRYVMYIQLICIIVFLNKKNKVDD